MKKVFQLGQFRSCRGKPPKPPRNKELENHRKSETSLVIGPPTTISSSHNNHRQLHGHHQHQHQHSRQRHHHQNHQRNRAATSGSDVSVIRHENGFQGLNRNSSSGYVLNRFDSLWTQYPCFCLLLLIAFALEFHKQIDPNYIIFLILDMSLVRNVVMILNLVLVHRLIVVIVVFVQKNLTVMNYVIEMNVVIQDLQPTIVIL